MLASNYFLSEWVEESEKLLFEVCLKHCISHKGPQKDINNIKA